MDILVIFEVSVYLVIFWCLDGFDYVFMEGVLVCICEDGMENCIFVDEVFYID